MEKRITFIATVGTVLLAIILLVLGVLIGRSLYEPQTVVLNANGEKSNSIEITENTITVVGQTRLDVKPEIAVISLGIEICDADAQEANLQVNDKLLSITTGLEEVGLDKKNIVPSAFSLYPQYDYSSSQNQLTGFCATNRIRVTTEKVDQVSNMIDKAITSGATNVYGVDFTAKDIEAASQEGIKLAYQDAALQAQVLAGLMNVSLDGIISSNVDMNGYLLDTLIGYSGGGGGVAPQDASMTVKVTVVYRVK